MQVLQLNASIQSLETANDLMTLEASEDEGEVKIIFH